MTDTMDIRYENHLLFQLSPDGIIELKRGDWLYRIDITEALRTGQAQVEKAYCKRKRNLTNDEKCGKISYG